VTPQQVAEASAVSTSETSGYDRVIEAAVELFAAKGFTGTGIREVAEAAGMVSASLYHWFPNKEALLVAIMRQGQVRFNACATTALAPLHTPEARIAALVRVHVAAHVRRQLEARVVDTEVRALSAASRAAMLPLRDAYERMWQDTISQGVAAGRFTSSNEKLTRLALLQMCSGVSQWYRADAELGLEAICDGFASMALAMVREARRPVPLAKLEGPPVQHYIRLVEDHWARDLAELTAAT
jgi:AcrR family transcriptional regulator